HTLLPAGDGEAAFRARVCRLSTAMRELEHARIDLLKMDVEGAEYAVIQDMLAGGIRPRQLLVEFHHRFRGVGRRATTRALQALEAAGYRIFHVSPTAREFAFILA